MSLKDYPNYVNHRCLQEFHVCRWCAMFALNGCLTHNCVLLVMQLLLHNVSDYLQ